MTQTLVKALQEVQQQIAFKTQLRDQLNIEIVKLQATEIGLRNLLGQQVQAETQWTDLVWAVLNSYPQGQNITATEIRDTLQSWGYSFEGINNPLAFVNTVLQRLANRGLIERSKRGRPFSFGRK